ncbi:hypothetical protein AMTRI_Chr05g67470 [Amborella trichopoda]|uniref:Histidine-containing phosphotransfer protein n=1 Tax=Amborella trichopoda TaxID=13333 RepID=U5CYW2_AMBTC|nr:histidine-containing phosphotransfer protein 4 [Amborella trichopoda]ERN15150.1 hypothetical protein AMTR_s00056p00131980 [Amborella trichopoda]|eukprot:XP_006853683.1 histidine-containing phosphotransfer protein 4 [Amborella trichopoda]
MEALQLHRQFTLYKNGLFDQGFLDEQFNQLEELQDESNPRFVEEVVTLFFKDSSRLLTNIEQALEKNPVDFRRLDTYMHQFKGSSSSIGAIRLKNECVVFRQFCEERNKEGCMRSFQQTKKEYNLLKKKLDRFFELERQLASYGMSTSP